MIGKEEALSFLRDAVKRPDGEQVEILMVAREVGCTRYANSSIHQNVHEDVVSVFVRVLAGGRLGLAKISSLNGEDLSRGINKAKEAADRGSVQDRFEAFPAPQDYTEVSAFSAETAGFDHRHRAESLGKIFSEAEKQGVQMAGAFTTGQEEVAIVNTSGIAAYQTSTFDDVSFTALSGKFAGHSGAVGMDIEELDLFSPADTAVDTALAGVEGTDLSPGQ